MITNILKTFIKLSKIIFSNSHKKRGRETHLFFQTQCDEAKTYAAKSSASSTSGFGPLSKPFAFTSRSISSITAMFAASP